MENQAKLDAIQAQINALKAEAKALTPKKERTLTIKVHEKGTVSVYGLQKFPVTLYPTQWVNLFKAMPEMMKTIQPLADAAIAAKASEAKTA